MWFWSNWTGEGYYSRETLEGQLSSFSGPTPFNNHIPHLVERHTGRFPGPTPEEEYSQVMSLLNQYEPYFTWNGDTSFWRSAADAVGSALNLLRGKKATWTLEEVSDVTSSCLEFLIKVGSILPDSTVGLSHEGGFDVLKVTPEEAMWVSKANIKANPDTESNPDQKLRDYDGEASNRLPPATPGLEVYATGTSATGTPGSAAVTRGEKSPAGGA
jgi:hypothetical protein